MILGYTSKREAINASREQAMAVNTADNRTLCRVLGKWKMYVDSRDISVAPHLMMDGIIDPNIVELICNTVRPGMKCADVGACFGFTSLLLSELVGPTGAVMAFEPHPRCFAMLKNNLEINNYCPRARPYPNAIGDADTAGKLGKLMTHTRRYGSATMSEKAKASFSQPHEEDVQVSKLDTLCASSHIEPDFYMIATEGYEPQVWAGMKDLLHKKRKITVLMSFIPRWYADAAALASDILDEGFLVTRVGGEVDEPLTDPQQFIGRFQSYLLLTR